MKRMQLFEFEDFRWFPSALRELMTLYIVTVHRLLGSERVFAPVLAKALSAAGTNHIVDLCSGAGGAMPTLLDELRERHGIVARATLTDLFPNREAATRLNAERQDLEYLDQPVDAAEVPSTLAGLRTMICSFHHMPATVARRILEDAFTQRQTLCIFEISANVQPRWLWWTAFPVGVLLVFAITPFIRPLTLRQLFFTYVVPILPLAIAWDGAASNARTYTAEDLRELTRGLEAPDYTWDITLLDAPRAGPMMALVGHRGAAQA